MPYLRQFSFSLRGRLPRAALFFLKAGKIYNFFDPAMSKKMRFKPIFDINFSPFLSFFDFSTNPHISSIALFRYWGYIGHVTPSVFFISNFIYYVCPVQLKFFQSWQKLNFPH